jgi:hypothetical protein
MLKNEHVFEKPGKIVNNQIYRTLKNFFPELQSSLTIKSLKGNSLKYTIRPLWKRLLSYLPENQIDQAELNELVSKPFRLGLPDVKVGDVLLPESGKNHKKKKGGIQQKINSGSGNPRCKSQSCRYFYASLIFMVSFHAGKFYR